METIHFPKRRFKILLLGTKSKKTSLNDAINLHDIVLDIIWDGL
jgi:hypothetical protein